jgi:flagellar biosynthesis/type III secretory pathway protein FliH
MTELEESAQDAWMDFTYESTTQCLYSQAFKAGFKKGYEKGQQESQPLDDSDAV